MKHVAALLIVLAACSEDGRPADGAQLLVPDEVEVEWDARLNEADDGLGMLVPVDLMVYEGSTGEPLELVRIEVDAGGWATVLDPDTVEAQHVDCDHCVWDAGRDRYVALSAPEADRPPLLTDADGMLRLYFWIDTFPTDGADLLPIPVDVDTGSCGASFELLGT